MEVLSLESHRKSYNFKMRKISKQEKELEFWKKSYEMMKNNKQKYINSALRKVRLSQLFEYIKKEQNKTKKKMNKNIKPKVKIKNSTDSLRRKWIQARKIGNEYSMMNKYYLFPTPGRWRFKDTESEVIHKENRVRTARTYGNICSQMNVQKLKFAPRRRSGMLRPLDKLTKMRRNWMDYGSYYSMRNKLYYKDTICEFDQEYQDLLLKCVAFEKEHLEVRGFLEEKFYTNLNFQRGIIAFAHQESQKRNARLQRRLEKQRSTQQAAAKPENLQLSIAQNQVSKNELIEHASTDQEIKVALSVQTDVIEESKIPKKEEFPSVTRISKSMPEVLRDQPKHETLLNTIKYESNYKLVPDFTNDASKDTPQQPESSCKQVEELRENFLNLSDAVLSGKSFEAAILEITKNYKCPDSHRSQMEQLLSDLFLAFGLNLVKSAVEQDVLKNDIDMIAVRDKATKQAEAISQVLNEVFRRH